MDWVKIKGAHVLDSELTDAEVGQLTRYQAKIGFYERPLSESEFNSTFTPKKLQKISKFLSEKDDICLEKVAEKVLEDVEKTLKKAKKNCERVRRHRENLRLKSKCRNDNVVGYVMGDVTVTTSPDVTPLEKTREEKSREDYKKELTDIHGKEAFEELIPLMTKEDALSVRQFHFILKSLKSKIDSDNWDQNQMIDVFLEDGALLDAFSSVYTEIKSKVRKNGSKGIVDKPKYKRIVKKALTGKLDEDWDVKEMSEDVVDFCGSQIDRILSYYESDKKQMDEKKKKEESESKRHLFLENFKSLPIEERKKIEDKAQIELLKESGGLVAVASGVVFDSKIIEIMEEENV